MNRFFDVAFSDNGTPGQNGSGSHSNKFILYMSPQQESCHRMQFRAISKVSFHVFWEMLGGNSYHLANGEIINWSLIMPYLGLYLSIVCVWQPSISNYYVRLCTDQRDKTFTKICAHNSTVIILGNGHGDPSLNL